MYHGNKKALKIATEYVHSHGFDMIERAGEKDGYEYFHFWIKRSEGQKLGNPLIIKVSQIGEIVNVLELTEIMWAFQESIKAQKQSDKTNK